MPNWNNSSALFSLEVLINIYYARRTHKLAEWHVLCDAIKSLPYADELILVKEDKKEG